MDNKYGSLEVMFQFPSSASKSLRLDTNIRGTKQFAVGSAVTEEPVSVIVTSTRETDEDTFVRIQTLVDDVVVDQSDFRLYTEADIDFEVRIFFFDQFISVTVGEKWVYSYALASVLYEEGNVTASLKLSGSTTTITNLRRVELADGREAVYVDYESSTENAIQSIIQQRPILINPHVNRKLSFTYLAEKDTISAVFVHKYSDETSIPTQASSDGLVYGDNVSVSVDMETARRLGFITRLYRLPELQTGATNAAGTTQKNARERIDMATVDMRFDPRLEMTDVLHVEKTITGTGRQISRKVIIESIQFSIGDADASMTVSGRRKHE